MIWAVVGGTGHTGRRVVERAVARGDEVISMARRVDPNARPHPQVRYVSVDVTDYSHVWSAIAAADAVICAVGVGRQQRHTTTYSAGVTNLLGAMSDHDIRRLSVVSAAPAGPRAEQGHLDRALVMPILDRFFGATYEDMRRMERVLTTSASDWVCLRPPRLVDKTGNDEYRVSPDGPLPGARSMSYDALASALMEVINRPDLYRRLCYVGAP